MDWRRTMQGLSVSPFILLFCFGAVCGRGVAQREITAAAKVPVMQGYITAVHLPDGFDMNDCHVLLSVHTAVGKIGNRKLLTNDPALRAELHLGAYVQVMGSFDAPTKTATADWVLFRDERAIVRIGKGRILRVVSAGPEPVYSADGYHIRVKSLRPASPDSEMTLQYTGKIGPDGILEATKAEFGYIAESPIDLTPSNSRDVPDSAVNSNGGVLQDPASTSDIPKSWAMLPPDQPLQKRVARIGRSLVPAYRSEKDGDSLAKIYFRFYAVDDEKMRSGYAIYKKRVILVPKQVVERLQNDSQLAAVLAEGMAQTLQIHSVGKGPMEFVIGSAAIGALVMVDPFVVLAYAVEIGELAPSKKNKPVMIIENPVLYQRGRIALRLMADAGYDPYQAPEAWRLLAPAHPASDPQSLPYPLRCGSQFNVIATQYQTHATPVAATLQ